jgi:glutaryl-CoA dehydrogenase (non-decarboxylating)
LLSDSHRAQYDDFRTFVALSVQRPAEAWDRAEQIPEAVIAQLGEAGYFGVSVPGHYGGQGGSVVSFGLLNEAFGRGSSALTDVITCQAMVTAALLKWGTADQRTQWLPSLAAGKTIAAFALTEPGAGSDTQAMVTEFSADGDHDLILTGCKKWISCAQFADLFLVFGTLGQRAVAALVPRHTPGLVIEPIRDLLGFRAAGLGQLHFNNVRVPVSNIVGRPGFGLSHVATVGLHMGRISTACSAAGLLRGCVEESVEYAATRRIGVQAAGDLGMIRTLLTRMATDAEAARLLCLEACLAEDDRDPAAVEKTLMAKYFASTAAVRAAADAVQIRGASGCHASSAVSRFYRDAKILEIIEGTTQIHEQLLGRMVVEHGFLQPPTEPHPQLILQLQS